MGVRFNKRIKLAKGVSLNVGKKGISTSIKLGNVSVNSKGRMTTSIPGTGVSYTENINLSTNKKDVINEATHINNSSKTSRLDNTDDIELDKSENLYVESSKKKLHNNVIGIFMGVIAVLLPIILVAGYILFIKNQSTVIQLCFGVLSGLSTLPIMLLIGTKVQNKKY